MSRVKPAAAAGFQKLTIKLTKMKAAKINEIAISEYQKILSEIQKEISQTQENILNNATRQKVEMAWKIGQIIDRSLVKKDEKIYGTKLIKQLEKDVGISETVLYKMRSFYKTYPKIPKDDPRLNWSHYRILSGIKKAGERKVLENLAKKNSWDSDSLQQEVVKTKISQIRENKARKAVVTPKKKITPLRGKLFSYQIKKIIGSEKYFLDCGFGVFREIKEPLANVLRQDGQIVTVSKIKDETYSIKKSAIRPQELHAYKAFVEKVVDGDTIRVNLDLGFGIFHREILRLAKINASEVSTEAGEECAKVLTEILKDLPFLIIRTIKTDIYGRYVADVFLPQFQESKQTKSTVELTLQRVADEGIYLNQMLLDLKLVQIYSN